MTRLDGKAAIVSGGASGIGAGAARRLRACGAAVCITDISRPAAPDLACTSSRTVLKRPDAELPTGRVSDADYRAYGDITIELAATLAASATQLS